MSVRIWPWLLPADVIEDQVDPLLQVIVVKPHHPGYYPPVSIEAVTEIDQDPILATVITAARPAGPSKEAQLPPFLLPGSSV